MNEASFAEWTQQEFKILEPAGAPGYEAMAAAGSRAVRKIVGLSPYRFSSVPEFHHPRLGGLFGGDERDIFRET